LIFNFNAIVYNLPFPIVLPNSDTAGARMAVEIRDQIDLPLSRCFDFCLSSIKHRFFRSMVTLAVVVLAVAFLMNILTEGIITRSVAQGVEREFGALYAGAIFVKRLKKDAPIKDYAADLARLPADSPRMKELARWSGLDEEGFRGLAAAAKQEAVYARFFEKRKFTDKKILLGGREDGDKIFQYLSDPEGWKQFEDALRQPAMASVKAPGAMDEMKRFCAGWPAYHAALGRLKQRADQALDAAAQAFHAKTATAARPESGSRTIEEYLTRDVAEDPSLRAPLAQFLIEAAGIETTPAEVGRICDELHLRNKMDSFKEYATDQEFRTKWGELKTNVDYSPDELLKRYLDDADVREWVEKRKEAIKNREKRQLAELDPDKNEERLLKEIKAFAADYARRVEESGRAEVAPESEYARTKNMKNKKQKAFLASLGPNEAKYAEGWKSLKALEAYSPAALLRRYPQSSDTRLWVTKMIKAAPPKDPDDETRELKEKVTDQDITDLADKYGKEVVNAGIKGCPLAEMPASETIKKFLAYLYDPQFRNKWDELGLLVGWSAENFLLQFADEQYGARMQSWLLGISKDIGGRRQGAVPATAEEIMGFARLFRSQSNIQGLKTEVQRKGGSESGKDRTFWLIVVSFVVCVVGIANAMLMAVTERFREIATMKCLGAQDRFIMIIFLMESGLMGIIGGLGGVVVGLILAMIRCVHSFGYSGFWRLWWVPVGILIVSTSLGALFRIKRGRVSTGALIGLAAGVAAVLVYWVSFFGGLVISDFPVWDVLLNMAISTAAGCLLAMLAAMYPAWVASRMAPMEAMRVE
jgi:hypothetical protein